MVLLLLDLFLCVLGHIAQVLYMSIYCALYDHFFNGMKKCCQCYCYCFFASWFLLWMFVLPQVFPKLLGVVWEEQIRKLNVVLTLSYLMDLWLCRKFCPSFEVSRSGGWVGKVCLGRLQLCDGLLLGVLPDPPGLKQFSGQSQYLTYLATGGKSLLQNILFICQIYVYTR